MHPGCDIASDPASRLARAVQVLRAQLEALAGLAAIAIRMVEGIVPPRIAADPHRPMAGVVALERAVSNHARLAWALRLIWALRAKLVGDLARVERGEGVDEVLAAEARAAVVVDRDDDGHDDDELELDAERESVREYERPERESFGRYLSGRTGEAEFADILKRPTEQVIALIREALRLDGAPSDEPADLDLERWRGERRPGPFDRGLALSPAPSGSALRSPYPA